jgi:AGCS family alanine or glycine:cation symporter
MLDVLTQNFEFIEECLWGYLCLPLIILFGLYFTLRSRFFQIRNAPKIFRLFWGMIFKKKKSTGVGSHPIAVFFTSIGGCIGIGNVVAICTAVQVGGPGAVFWIWVGGFLGMIIKYGEVYLGMKYRVPNQSGGYDGGPMYFLPKAYKTVVISIIVALCLMIYGTEIFMFRVVTDSIVVNWGWSRGLVVAGFLFLILFAGTGGIKRVGKLCSAIIPLFLVLYVGIGLVVLIQNWGTFMQAIGDIFHYAFTPLAAGGGFLGTTIMLTMQQGVERGAYSGDIGIGYASIVHSESRVKEPSIQASLAIFGIVLDTFVICTMSVFLVLATGVWQQGLGPEVLVQAALETVLPNVHVFMPFFLFLLGYSTIIAFFFVGLKSSRYLHKKWGPICYYIYAICAFLVFSLPQVSMTLTLTLMQIAGGILLLINVVGIFLLRKKISFTIAQGEEST